MKDLPKDIDEKFKELTAETFKELKTKSLAEKIADFKLSSKVNFDSEEYLQKRPKLK